MYISWFRKTPDLMLHQLPTTSTDLGDLEHRPWLIRPQNSTAPTWWLIPLSNWVITLVIYNWEK